LQRCCLSAIDFGIDTSGVPDELNQTTIVAEFVEIGEVETD
jgi:hypothetical protein